MELSKDSPKSYYYSLFMLQKFITEQKLTETKKSRSHASKEDAARCRD
jgi:hypothetical protein